MQLLPDEEILVTSSGDTIILTSHRIQQASKEWGRSYQITIFLENISSIEVLYKSNPLFLVIAGICFLFGLITVNQAQANGATLPFGGFMAGIIFLILWVYSRNHQVSISSNGGGKLNFRVDNMKTLAVADFVDKVIQAKARRVQYIRNI